MKGALAYSADAAKAAREWGMHGGLEDIAREIPKEELEETRRHCTTTGYLWLSAEN